MSVSNPELKVPSKTTIPVPHYDSAEEEADRKWKEAFANTTEEEFAYLEKMFTEEEEKHGTTPLRLKGR